MSIFWDLQIAQRWEVIRAKARQLGWDNNHDLRIKIIAQHNGMRWSANSKPDLVSDFISNDLPFFFKSLKSLGPKKSQYLMEVLEVALSNPETLHLSKESNENKDAICQAVLNKWLIPNDYPIEIVFKSNKIIAFCKRKGIYSVLEIIRTWANLGLQGMLEQVNIERRNVKEIHDFINAVANADAVAARLWLPLNEKENGLCLSKALLLMHSRYSPQCQTTLSRRIIEGYSLEAAGNASGVPSHRVRQMELAYMRNLELTLSFFDNEREAMLDAWVNEIDWKSFIPPFQCSDSEFFILSAIEAYFYKSPRGIARRLATESSLNSCIEIAMNHPDLHLKGFDLQKFLDTNVPIKLHEAFIGEIASKPTLVIDYGTGIVRSSSNVRNILLCRD
jgi:hypothetical protein